MKRALALLAACSLFGFAGLAQITGTWDVTLEFGPLGTTCTTLYPSIGISSDLTLNYEFCGWTFSSISSFDESGFASQEFSASGALGPLTVSSTMDFIPAFATAYTNTPQTESNCCYWKETPTSTTPKFDSWDVTAGLTFGGVDFEVYFLLEANNETQITYTGYYIPVSGTPVQTASSAYLKWVQTASQTTCPTAKNGSGWRIKLAGSLNGCTITSYTYFGMTEADATSTVGCPVIGKKGTFTMAKDCDVSFEEEYLMIEDVSFACMTLDMALKVSCTGFDYFKVILGDISFLPWLNLTAGITFTTTSKDFVLCGTIATVGDICFTVAAAIDSLADGTISGISIYGISVSYEFSDCLKFTSDTSFNTTKHSIKSPIYGGSSIWSFYPAIVCEDTSATFGEGEEKTDDVQHYYKIQCVNDERYVFWEKFGVEFCGPGCCGGEWEFSVNNYFGKKETLDWFGWAYYDGSNWTYYVYDGGSEYFTATKWEEYYKAEGATWSPTVTTGKESAPVSVTDYDAATSATLFGWAETEVDFTLPVSTSLSITGGLNVSVYGWESFELGFSLSF